MTTPAKYLSRTRLIGFIAMGGCVVGYGGMAAFLLAAKLGAMSLVQAAVLAGVSGLIGEIGLWVGAACLGLSLFKKRTAQLKSWQARLSKAKAKVHPQV